MLIDDEGHLLVSPKEICEALISPQWLIHDILIPGTPASFPSYACYRDFLNACGDSFGVHPQNFQDHNQRLKSLPVEHCCGLPRPIDAFVFRDWWSLSARWESDLRDLKKALANGLPQGGDQPVAQNV